MGIREHTNCGAGGAGSRRVADAEVLVALGLHL